MTKYFRNYLAIISVIEIANNKNNTSAFADETFLCLRESTPFEVSSCFAIKYFFYKYTFIPCQVSRQALHIQLLQNFKHWPSANS